MHVKACNSKQPNIFFTPVFLRSLLHSAYTYSYFTFICSTSYLSRHVFFSGPQALKAHPNILLSVSSDMRMYLVRMPQIKSVLLPGCRCDNCLVTYYLKRFQTGCIPCQKTARNTKKMYIYILLLMETQRGCLT